MSRCLAALLFIAGTLVGPARIHADEPLTSELLKKLTLDQKVGGQISPQLVFRNENNESAPLGKFLEGRPAILILGYYACPMLCNLVLNGVVESLQEIIPEADQGVRVIFVSIDPRESPALALAKKRNYLKRYGRPGAGSRWHFLCGDQPTIDQLASEAGFHFRYDPINHQFAHPSGILVLTPSGRISRYFFGVSYPAAELKAALADAAQKRTGSVVEEFLLLCSQFVPLTGKYSATIMGMVRLLAIGTVVAILGVVFVYRRQHSTARQPKGGPGP